MVKIRLTLLPDNAARMPDPPYADVVVSAPYRDGRLRATLAQGPESTLAETLFEMPALHLGEAMEQGDRACRSTGHQ